ncbi:hypothetical protein BS47DRAFT_868085 [Hydnum rufescens UP504]|uniref:Uncharacterized protein n=1 Tax=Hydnum rufescens UP504 TaxID=1448309 RepID=A0A9P6AZC2_9AGAM|nr:hypothetical protein BS47DRAFT_868085 [Hydnum rufescens UP504]
MPSRGFSSLRGSAASLASPQSNDPAPGGPPSIAQSTPGPSTAPQPAYPDYMNENTSPGWDAAVAMASMLDNIPSLPLALAGPLSQVLDVISGMIDAVKAVREGKHGCEHLIFRVLKFLQSLVDESRGSSVPIVEGTPTAARLFALKRNVMAIRDDALRWSQLSLVKRYAKREEIKIEISRHGENLTDCFHTFVLTSLRASNLVDRVERIVFPNPSVPLATPEEARDLLALGLQDFFKRPAGEAVFEQIAGAVQQRLEQVGLQATSSGSQSPGTTVLRTGNDRHVSYLTSQIAELTSEVGNILPSLSLAPAIDSQFIQWKTHWSETGNPMQQLRGAISATLQLLNELQDIAKVKLDLARKMSDLSLNLHDLGLWEEADEIQTIVVELDRAGGDTLVLAISLNTHSVFLMALGHHEEALKACEEAVNICRASGSDQVDVPRLRSPADLFTISPRVSRNLAVMKRHSGQMRSQ